MRIRRYGVLLVGVWTIYASATAATAADAPPPGLATQYASQVIERRLANGFHMILLADHKAPVATVQVWYRVGSRNEVAGTTGISHLLEHMMFKGTGRHPPEEYSRIIARNGGNENAFTSDDATTYFATLASDRIDVELELEADRMRGLTIPEDQLVRERQVVEEERRLRTDDNPVALLFEQLGAATFLAHPYRNPTIGWATDIAGLQRADLVTWYDRYYQPGNAFLVAVGDFDADALAERVGEIFGAIPAGLTPPPVRAIEPPQLGPRRVVVERPARLPFVALQWHAPNLHHADSPALLFVEAILAGGRSARLHRELVHGKRLALEIGAAYDRTSIDDKSFVVYGQPQPGKSIDELERALLAEVEKLRQRAPTDEEMAKARRQVEASFVFAQDSGFYRAMLLGTYELCGGWRQIDDLLPALARVTAEDVRRVAERVLDPQQRTTGTLIPKGVPPDRPPSAGPHGPGGPGGGLVR